MVSRSVLRALVLACLIPLFCCYPVESDLSSSGSGAGRREIKAPQPKVTIPSKPRTIDHSRGVYMHAHDFNFLPGAPGGAFHAQYMHASGGIGKSRKRSLRETMMKMFKIRERNLEAGIDIPHFGVPEG